MRPRLLLVLLCVALTSGVARADTIIHSGFFSDPGNTALMWSDMGAPRFLGETEIANNVALYDLTIPNAGTVEFRSKGYAAGGAAPYFTLFSGTLASPAAATFVTSSYFDSDIDFNVSTALGVGTYVIALGVWVNMSFAENYGVGTLNDGFICLGEPGYLPDGYYELEVTRPDGEHPPIPEPTTMLLVGSGLAGLSRLRRRLDKA